MIALRLMMRETKISFSQWFNLVVTEKDSELSQWESNLQYNKIYTQKH